MRQRQVQRATCSSAATGRLLPNFPFDRFPQVDVQLRYDDPQHAIRQDDVVRLTKEQPNTTWQRFLVGAPAAPIMAKITYRGADHRDRDTPFARPKLNPPLPLAYNSVSWFTTHRGRSVSTGWRRWWWHAEDAR